MVIDVMVFSLMVFYFWNLLQKSLHINTGLEPNLFKYHFSPRHFYFVLSTHKYIYKKLM